MLSYQEFNREVLWTDARCGNRVMIYLIEDREGKLQYFGISNGLDDDGNFGEWGYWI